MNDADRVTYDASGLVTVVAQDAATGEVLMVAHMTREALERTLATGQAWYWSRSRQQLWRKGETSGHTQKLVAVRGDCDGDAVLLKVEQTGPACHTGHRSCFFRSVAPDGRLVDGSAEARSEAARTASPEILTELAAVLAERRRTAAPGSYTAKLFAEGLGRLNEKVMEEAAEVARAARKETSGRLVEETADLWFHSLALLVHQGISPTEVFAELARRRR